MKEPLRILGVMTGTSCDGLDAACIEIDGQGWSPVWATSAEYPAALRKRVLEIQKPGARLTTKSLLELDRDLGLWFARTLKKLTTTQAPQPDVIANHGQTVAHFPDAGVTLQLGDPSRIAAATGLTVVSAFRDGDMAAGGQGAPLVPLFHSLIAHSVSRGEAGIAIHNLGGISNLTYIGPKEEILAFDTGPGNLWLDGAAEIATRGRLKMDRDGMLSARGTPDSRAIQALLKHPYFKKPPPKSTGRDDFPMSLLLSKTRARDESLVTTAAILTIESIARAYESQIIKKKKPLDAIFLAGGGAKNPTLVEGLAARLPKISVTPLTEAGFDGQWIEAQAFAYFGCLSLLGQPLGGRWTGAKGFGPPGRILPGTNWRSVLTKITALSEAIPEH